MTGSAARVEPMPGAEVSRGELLLREFQALVSADGGVEHLRRLVLELAIQGRLTDARRDDGSAMPLYEAARRDRVQRVAEGRARHMNELRDVTVDDAPWTLPSGWMWTRVGLAMNLVNGRAFKPSDWSTSGTPIIRIQNLNNAAAPFNYCNFSVEPKHHLRAGDFLISWSGTPGTSFGAFIWNGPDGVLNQHIFRGEVYGDTYDLKFLRVAINARLDEMIAQAHGGVGLQHITKGKLEALPIPLPPLAEQKRIVAKVDQLMALCDELEAKQAKKRDLGDRLTKAAAQALSVADSDAAFATAWHRVREHFSVMTSRPEHLDDIWQAVLVCAFRGRLTAPKGVGRTLQVIAAEGAADSDSSGRAATTDVRPGICALAVGPAKMPVPTGWRWLPLMKVARLESGHTPSRNHPEYWGGPVPWIGIKDARIANGKVIAETAQSITQEGLDNSSARLLPKGTVCLSRTASVGYVTVMGKPMATSQDFVNWVCSDDLRPRYLMHLLMCERPSLLSFSEGAVHRTIYFPEVKAFHIALPPVEEQDRIVEQIEQLQSVFEGLKAELERTAAAASRLAASLCSAATGTASA